MNKALRIDHSKISNLPKISHQDKIVLCEQTDTENQIKAVLWLERTKYKGKERISLKGAAYKKTSLNHDFVLQNSDVLGYHQINKNGEETIRYSVEPYDLESLYDLIVH